MQKRIALGGVMLCLAAPGTAAAAYAPHQVLVKFDSGVPAAPQLAQLRAAGATGLGGQIDAVGVRVVPVAVDPALAATRLNRLASVEYAEVDKVLSTTAIPNDPRFGELYGLNNTVQSGGTADADIDAPEGWDL